MADVVFEYEDDKGETHRVHSIQQVPKRYLKKVLSYEQESAKTVTVSESWSDTLSQISERALQKPASVYLLPVLLIVIWHKFNNFLIRTLVAVTAGSWLFLHGYNWFMRSNYSKLDTELPRRSLPR